MLFRRKFMPGYCGFCHTIKELTNHHIIARAYRGPDNPDNLIPNICRDCHDQLDNTTSTTRGDLGAGREVPPLQDLRIGQTELQLRAGSVYLDERGNACLDAGSQIYAMRCHLRNGTEKDIELSLSGGSVVFITGSVSSRRRNNWVIFSYAAGPPL